MYKVLGSIKMKFLLHYRLLNTYVFWQLYKYLKENQSVGFYFSTKIFWQRFYHQNLSPSRSLPLGPLSVTLMLILRCFDFFFIVSTTWVLSSWVCLHNYIFLEQTLFYITNWNACLSMFCYELNISHYKFKTIHISIKSN